jgi:hypothetical protein
MERPPSLFMAPSEVDWLVPDVMSRQAVPRTLLPDRGRLDADVAVAAGTAEALLAIATVLWRGTRVLLRPLFRERPVVVRGRAEPAADISEAA